MSIRGTLGAVAFLVAAAVASAQQQQPLPVGVPFEAETSEAVSATNVRWAIGPEAMDVGDLRAASFEQSRPGEDGANFGPFLFEPFDECLLSWNIRHDPASGFGVEIAVARDGQSPFSPWMWIGEWNVSKRPAELVQSFEDGRIDVDTFTSPTTWRAVKVRIRLRSAPGEEPSFALDRLTLMPTLRSARGDFGAPARAVERLAVPFRSQRAEGPALASRICSPTSLAMVLAWRGADAPTAEVARRAYDPFHDLYGNWNRAIQAAYSFGVPGRLERIATWARAEELVRAGSPLIVSIAAQAGQLAGAPYASTAGHLLVLCGFDAEGDVLVNDPAAGSPAAGLVTYARAEFETVWLARGGTAYVLEAPGAARR